MLHGSLAVSPAISAMVAGTVDQWAWMWSALHSRARSASHNPFGYTTKFLRRTPVLRLLNRQPKSSNAAGGFPINCLTAASAMPAETIGLVMTWFIRGLASPCSNAPRGYVG